MTLKPIFLLFFSLAFQLLSAQIEVAPTAAPSTTEDKTFDMFDISKPPSFPGGEAAMMQYIGENLKYPAVAREHNIQGTVVLTFVVGKDGSVSDIKVVKDIGAGCGKESQRVIETMPKWMPGEANGQPVKVRYTLPIRFKLDDNASTSPPTEEKGLKSKTQVWAVVSEGAKNICRLPGLVEQTTPFEAKSPEEMRLLSALEMAFKTKLSEVDKKGFKQLAQVSDYFYQAQFAPTFYTNDQFRSKQANILTNRADFDTNADGLGKIGSIKVPKGIKVVLYSKKNFKGKKLEFFAEAGPLEIPDWSAFISGEGKIKAEGKGVNWGLNTQSVKVILPKGFPEGQ